MTILQIGSAKYHHQSGAKELNRELLEKVDAGKLVDLLLGEQWKGQCEIVPDYMPPFPDDKTQPRCVVRFRYQAKGEHVEEDTYSYLRYSCGPKQGFFWDCYGDDMHSIEVALLALHQAPAPVYCGPLVFKLNLPTTPQP